MILGLLICINVLLVLGVNTFNVDAQDVGPYYECDYCLLVSKVVECDDWDSCEKYWYENKRDSQIRRYHCFPCQGSDYYETIYVCADDPECN